jgi:hypothetical protein
MTMGALIAFGTKTNRGLPTQNRSMSSGDLMILTIELGGHLATLMTRCPFHSAFDGDLSMTDTIRRHAFDRHIRDIEGYLKGLAHAWTRS